MFRRFVSLTLLVLAVQPLAAAAQAPDPGLLALQATDRRVATIAYRLARGNLEICPKTMPLSGLLVHSIDQYGTDARPIAAATFGLAEEPALLVVVPGSPADKAGLREGDRLVGIGGQAPPAASPAKKGHYNRIRRIEEDLLGRMQAGPVALHYLRGTERRTATLAPERGCLSRVQTLASPKLNAKADGTYAQLTTGIVEFARSDDELALVIAHEMAHNILGHRMRLDEEGVSRGIFKSIDGSAGKIKAAEKEADYLALYLLARAGFDVAAAPAFWDRYGRKTGWGIFSDGTHPGRSSRIEAAERAIAEIRAKQAKELPLVPDPVRGS